MEKVETKFSKEEIVKEIEDYISVLMYCHDLAPWRNDTNKKIKDKIVEKCVADVEKHNLQRLITNKKQIEAFIIQTILYMVY